MAIHVLKDQKCWLDGYDLTGHANRLALEYAAELQDDTVFGDDTRSRLGGLKEVTAAVEGLWEGTNIDAALFNAIGVADKPMSFGAAGGAEGDVAYSFLANAASYSPGARVGEIFRFGVQAEASGALIRGTLMHNAARTATANGTGRQLGAVSAAQKLYATLHVIAVDDPADTLSVTIESDAGDTWAGAQTTRHTFALASAIGSEWATPVAGAITDTWWRITYTITGVTPSFEFAVVVGIQ